MINFDSAIESNALWLGDLLSTQATIEIEKLCSQSNLEKLPHKHFILPYSNMGERGFICPTDTDEQAYLQVLAHAGCIPSCLLFGLSLSGQQSKTRRVLSKLLAFEYMYLGIEFLLHNHTHPAFMDEADYMLVSSSLVDIFRFIVEKGPSLGFDLQDSPVIQFANISLQGMTSVIKS